MAAARLADSPAVLVLDAGHPTGIVTRSDLLEFLSGRAGRPPVDAGDPTSDRRGNRRADARLRDPGHPRRPGPRPGHRGGHPAHLAGHDLRPGRGGQARGASSTPAAATRPGPPSRRAWPRWKGAAHGLAFSSGLAAEDAILHLLRPATT